MDNEVQSLRLQVEQVGDLGVLRLHGEIDNASAPLLGQQAAAMLDDGSRSLVLDLADVTFMDSSGINALVQARKGAHARGGTLTIRHASPSVRRVMTITGLGSLLVPELSEP